MGSLASLFNNLLSQWLKYSLLEKTWEKIKIFLKKLFFFLAIFFKDCSFPTLWERKRIGFLKLREGHAPSSLAYVCTIQYILFFLLSTFLQNSLSDPP